MTNRYAYVWSPVYVDAMVLRDKDATGDGYEQRLYVQHDANFNTTAITNASGSVQQRFVEDAYGSPTYLTASWGSGSSTAFNWIYIHQGLRLENGGLGLYDMRTRTYSPTLGRPMQMDSAGYAAGMNGYEAYASNPTNLVDPRGTKPQYPDPGFEGGGRKESGGVTLLPRDERGRYGPPEILPHFQGPDGAQTRESLLKAKLALLQADNALIQALLREIRDLAALDKLIAQMERLLQAGLDLQEFLGGLGWGSQDLSLAPIAGGWLLKIAEGIGASGAGAELTWLSAILRSSGKALGSPPVAIAALVLGVVATIDAKYLGDAVNALQGDLLTAARLRGALIADIQRGLAEHDKNKATLDEIDKLLGDGH